MNQVKVYVAGRSYSLQSTEEAGYVARLGQQLDQKIRGIMQQSAGISVSDACVLIALELLDGQEKTGNNSDHLRKEAQEYINQANQVSEEMMLLRQEIETLKAENDRLQTEVSLASLQSSLKKK